LEALAEYVERTPWRRAAVSKALEPTSFSPSLFWRYWSSLEDALHALEDKRRAEQRPLSPHLECVLTFLKEEQEYLEAAPYAPE
jgi:hypothetical protein